MSDSVMRFERLRKLAHEPPTCGPDDVPGLPTTYNEFSSWIAGLQSLLAAYDRGLRRDNDDDL